MALLYIYIQISNLLLYDGEKREYKIKTTKE